MHPVLYFPLATMLPGMGEPPPPPPELSAMLRGAMASGSEGDVATIVRLARTASPRSVHVLASEADKWSAARRETATRRLRESPFLALVKGRAEVGGFVSGGNTQNAGVTAVLDLQREGLRWRHKLRLQADYQESFGQTSREHYLAAYEPNFRVSDRLYAYGAAQCESDRLLGYYDRYSVSLGAGYTALRRNGVTLDLELGPAFRNTEFTDATVERNLAARGSLDLDWQLTPALAFRQDTSAYLQDANSTVSSTTALDAKLIGPLSARLSYAVQYESMPSEGRVNTDTTGRASLVYAF